MSDTTRRSDDSKVICPQCCHEFAAIPVNVQEELAAANDALKSEREECAKLCEPKAPRPCDCERCDCGNSGDAWDVAQWDEATALAKAIRERGKPAQTKEKP